MKTKSVEKPSIASIVDPLLKAGKLTRAQIVEQVAKLRPDFKCPSAGVSNRQRALAGGSTGPKLARQPAVKKGLSAGDIAEPMLLKGGHTRAEIMAEIARVRPDFKDPSAAVSNRYKMLQDQGKNPGLKEGPRRERADLGGLSQEAAAERRYKRGCEKLDEYVKRNDEEVAAYVRRINAFEAAAAKEPRLRRVWP